MATIIRLERRIGSGIGSCGLETLINIAAAFDCALIVRFCSWGEWVEWIVTPLGAVRRFRDDPMFAKYKKPRESG